MRKIIVAAAAAVGLASVAFVGTANAQSQCFWNGYSWSCPQPYYAPSYNGYYGYYPAPGYYPNSYITAGKSPAYPGPRAN